jgi:septal ring factor EnvC (AmiA/AmiB activator)
MRPVGFLSSLTKGLRGDGGTAESRVAELEGRLSTALYSLKQAEERLAPLESGLRAGETALLETRVRLAELEERSAAGETRVDETHAKNDRLGGRLLRMEAQLASVADRLAAGPARDPAVESGLEPRLAAAESRHAALEGRMAPLESRTQSHEGRLGSLAETLLAAEERTGSLVARVSSLESRTTGLDVPRIEGALRGLEARIAHLEQASVDLLRENTALRERAERLGRIAAVTQLVDREPPRDVLVSLVLPTRNRAGLLATALASVLAQRHAAWELLVVDDGSSDSTRESLERTRDARIRGIRAEGVGPAAARNRALAESRGAVIAYLDDDNALSPLWLHAVVWAFETHPERTVLYGAQAVQESAEAPGAGPLERRVWIRFEPWDRDRLERGNYIDLGAVAHRRELPDVHFDESVTPLEDWDLLLRLTRQAAPLELPVVSGTYRSDAPGRVTPASDPTRSQELIRAKVEAARAR